MFFIHTMKFNGVQCCFRQNLLQYSSESKSLTDLFWKSNIALFFSRRLSSGKLQDLGITDGSKLTLVPTVEAGLMVKIA